MCDIDTKIRYFLRVKISFSLANQKPRMIIHKYLVHTRNKFHISSQPCNILYIIRTFYIVGCQIYSHHQRNVHKHEKMSICLHFCNLPCCKMYKRWDLSCSTHVGSSSHSRLFGTVFVMHPGVKFPVYADTAIFLSVECQMHVVFYTRFQIYSCL